MPKPAATKTLPLRSRLIRLVDKYCAVKGLARSTVSSRLCKGGLVLDRIASGEADCNTASFERIVKAISDDWPANVAWPKEIERPAREAA